MIHRRARWLVLLLRWLISVRWLLLVREVLLFPGGSSAIELVDAEGAGGAERIPFPALEESRPLPLCDGAFSAVDLPPQGAVVINRKDRISNAQRWLFWFVGIAGRRFLLMVYAAAAVRSSGGPCEFDRYWEGRKTGFGQRETVWAHEQRGVRHESAAGLHRGNGTTPLLQASADDCLLAQVHPVRERAGACDRCCCIIAAMNV